LEILGFNFCNTTLKTQVKIFCMHTLDSQFLKSQAIVEQLLNRRLDDVALSMHQNLVTFGETVLNYVSTPEDAERVQGGYPWLELKEVYTEMNPRHASLKNRFSTLWTRKDQVITAASALGKAFTGRITAADDGTNERRASVPLVMTTAELLAPLPSPETIPRNRCDSKGYPGPTGGDDYLDTQFLLLRADCFIPCHQALSAYRAGTLRESNLTVYSGVTLCGLRFDQDDGVTRAVRFVGPARTEESWDRGSYLQRGGLVCLSPDNFAQEVFWATVAHRDNAELAKRRELTIALLPLYRRPLADWLARRGAPGNAEVCPYFHVFTPSPPPASLPSPSPRSPV
jgi:hypothetical protein